MSRLGSAKRPAAIAALTLALCAGGGTAALKAAAATAAAPLAPGAGIPSDPPRAITVDLRFGGHMLSDITSAPGAPDRFLRAMPGEMAVGSSVTGALGYHGRSPLRLDLEMSYVSISGDEIERQILADSVAELPLGSRERALFTPAVVEAPDVGAFKFLLNVFYDFDIGLDFRPFVGVGGGVVNFSAGGMPLSRDSDSFMALQTHAGFVYPINERLTVSLAYRGFATDDSVLGGRQGPSETRPVASHAVDCGFRLSF